MVGVGSPGAGVDVGKGNGVIVGVGVGSPGPGSTISARIGFATANNTIPNNKNKADNQ